MSSLNDQKSQYWSYSFGNEILPTEMSVEEKAVLEVAGVVFLGVIKDNSMFQQVKLPDGWEIRDTGRPMWFGLVDEKGRKRADVFYLREFLNHLAWVEVVCRYSIEIVYYPSDEDKAYVAKVKDGDAIIFTTDPVQIEEGEYRCFVRGWANDLAETWLDEHYPGWKDASAYWD